MTTQQATTNKPSFVTKENAIISYKAFDPGIVCREFKYELDKEHFCEGTINVCSNGFHACPDAKDVFDFYPPAGSVFAIVKQWGELSWEDTKLASQYLEIVDELSLDEFIGVMTQEAEGAASTTGYRGAASATGYASRVSGASGNALFLAERDGDCNIVAVWAGIVGRDGVQPNVWYTLQDGKLTKWEDSKWAWMMR